MDQTTFKANGGTKSFGYHISIEALEICFRDTIYQEDIQNFPKALSSDFINYTYFLLQETSDYLSDSLHPSGYRIVDLLKYTDSGMKGE